MSTTDQMRTRETARRAFADEYNNAEYVFKEGDSDQSPKYALLPSGQKANRVFIVGTLTDIDELGGGGNYRGHVTDPTGKFFVYASEMYQPEAASVLTTLETPEYVAIVGKPETFTDDEGETYVNVRAERVIPVDRATRHSWVGDTAEQTMERIKELRSRETIEDRNYDPYEHYDEEVVESVSETVVEALETLGENLEE